MQRPVCTFRRESRNCSVFAVSAVATLPRIGSHLIDSTPLFPLPQALTTRRFRKRERFDSTCKNIPPVPDEGRKMIGKVCANRSITWLDDRQRKTATSFSLQKLFVSVGFVILEKTGWIFYSELVFWLCSTPWCSCNLSWRATWDNMVRVRGREPREWSGVYIPFAKEFSRFLAHYCSRFFHIKFLIDQISSMGRLAFLKIVFSPRYEI